MTNVSPPTTPLRYAWYVTKEHRAWAIGALAAVTSAEILEGAQYVLIQKLINSITAAVSTGSSDLSQVWLWGLIYPALFFVTENVWRMSGFCGMRWVTRLETTSYRKLFSYLTNHSTTFFNNRFAGSLTNKIGHATYGTHHIVTSVLWEFYPMFIGIFVILGIVFTVHPLLATIMGTWFVLFLSINMLLVRKQQPISYEHAQSSSTLKGKMVDSASNMAAVHQTGHHDYEKEYVESYIKNTQDAHFRSWWFSEWILFTNGVLLALFTAGMIGTSIWLVQVGSISVGSLVMILTMVMNLQHGMFFIGSKMTAMTDHYSQVKEGLQEILVPHDIVDTVDAKTIDVQKGSIELADITFNYGEKTVFDRFDLKINPGEKVGLVGISGAGKSTMVSLLLRQFDVQAGAVMIDDQDVKDVTLESLRKSIAMVPQDTSLFHRTITENIRYGRLDASDDEVMEAAKLAEAHDFIAELPEGYETYVGERGVKLSGGQRQRIAVARAILKNAPILILDEATSSLDSDSEAAIQEALAKLMQGKTVLAIAHRLSTLQAMDRIIVLDAGEIIEDGTHAELTAQKDGLYKHLWESQVSGFIQ